MFVTYITWRTLGLPEERVTVTMKEKMTNKTDNPYLGMIFNQPNRLNVYEGVPHDFTGDQATKDAFVRLL